MGSSASQGPLSLGFCFEKWLTWTKDYNQDRFIAKKEDGSPCRHCIESEYLA
jgi:hypothetical protein